MSKSTTKKKRLRNKADKLWQQTAIQRWGDVCVFYGSPFQSKNCQRKTNSCHHYFPKGSYGHLRYEIDNAVPLCWKCHFSYESRPDPLKQEYIKSWLGEKYEILKQKAQERPASFQTIGWYEQQITSLDEYRKTIR